MATNNQFIVLEEGEEIGNKGEQQDQQGVTQINNSKEWVMQNFNQNGKHKES